MKSDQKRIAVTGANGFVGANVVRSLLRQGHSVVGFGRTISRLPGLEFRQLDLAIDDLGDTFHDIDAVVHCAGQAHASQATDADYHANIVVATTKIVDALARHDRHQVLVNLSSIKAIGETLAVGSNETTPCHPVALYGKSKLTAERLVRDATGSIGTTVTLRPSPVYGPNGKGIIGLLSRLGNYGLIPPVTAETGKRSYVHLDDLTSAILFSLDRPDGNHTYCVSDGLTYTLSDVQTRLTKQRLWTRVLPPMNRTVFAVAQTGPWGKKLRLQDRLLSDCHVSPDLLMQETDWLPTRQLGSTVT